MKPSTQIMSMFVITALCTGCFTDTSISDTSTGSGALAYPLNDTGVVECGDALTTTDNNDLDCAAVGSTQVTNGTDGDGDLVPAGQDAVYGRDAKAVAGTLTKVGAGHAGFDFTKLDSNGDPLQAGAASWDCVKDNHTGLIWEAKTDDGGLRDKDWTYSWYNTDNNNNGGSRGTSDSGTCYSGGSGCDTEKYTADVNTEALCGYSDWRMPTPQEMVSIMRRDIVAPARDLDYFPLDGSTWNWTALPSVSVDDSAFRFSQDTAHESWAPKSYEYNIRLVRGGQ